MKTGNEDYRIMARFWGKLFRVNFAVDVVTGIAIEFQFGTGLWVLIRPRIQAKVREDNVLMTTACRLA